MPTGRAHPDAFAAIADPRRRALIEALASRPATATSLAADLPISRQAVAKHLSVLGAARVVERQRLGRETLYTLQPEALRDVSAWTERVGSEWERRLQRLRDVVSEQSERVE